VTFGGELNLKLEQAASVKITLATNKALTARMSPHLK
jgi:hypothetical protein